MRPPNAPVVSPPPDTVVSSPRNNIETKRIKSPEGGEGSAGEWRDTSAMDRMGKDTHRRTCAGKNPETQARSDTLTPAPFPQRRRPCQTLHMHTRTDNIISAGLHDDAPTQRTGCFPTARYGCFSPAQKQRIESNQIATIRGRQRGGVDGHACNRPNGIGGDPHRHSSRRRRRQWRFGAGESPQPGHVRGLRAPRTAVRSSSRGGSG